MIRRHRAMDRLNAIAAHSAIGSKENYATVTAAATREALH